MNAKQYMLKWQDPSIKKYARSLINSGNIRCLYESMSAALSRKKRCCLDDMDLETVSAFKDQKISSQIAQQIIYSSVRSDNSPSNAVILASQCFTHDGSKLDWNKEFDDKEGSMSLHRFGWVIQQVASGYGVPWKIIDSWLVWKNSKKGTKIPIWVMDSYTVSERICNLSLLLMISAPSDDIFVKRILDSINNDAFYLLQNLEYYGSFNTNNHILNNARALIFAGALLDNKKIFFFGLKLLKKQLPFHCSADGVFREASSHYQFVITRWIVEVGFILRYKDIKESDDLIGWISKMLEVCDRFIFEKGGKQYIPRIGDVSPDYPPEWYAGMTSAARRLLAENTKFLFQVSENCPSWANLFGISDSQISIDQPPIWISTKGDWMRLEKGGWSILAHVDADVSDPRPTHGHQDTLSFELAWQGNPVIIDRGRRDYTSTVNCKTSAVLDEFHNSLLIDGNRIGFKPKSFMSSDWLAKNRVKSMFTSENGGALLNISHPRGFIVPDVNLIERSWLVDPMKVDIRTGIKGEGWHSILLFLHIPKTVVQDVTEDGLVLEMDGEHKYMMKWKNLSLPIISETEWYPSYGKISYGKRLEWRCEVKLPWDSVITISPIAANRISKTLHAGLGI